MTERQHVSSGTTWEDEVGYARAVRVGKVVYVSGTTATGPEGKLVGGGDPYLQTKQALENVTAALQEAGAELKHVVRTRIYVTNIDNWEAIGRAHREFFADVKPATTMVEVNRLIDPGMLVEVEAEAVLD
jgi:enamine deaminase RidA (YjgF/YER057c/UK114 family)